MDSTDTAATVDVGPSASVPEGDTRQLDESKEQRFRQLVRSQLRDTKVQLRKVGNIGRFTVLEPLGRGGMGTVYAAYDPHLDRKVAIKLLRLDRSDDEEEQQRLWREAQALARLSHPNVVTVHEVGHSGDDVFVAMEFVRGESLSVWQETRPAWPQVLRAYVGAGQGLAAAHAADLVHRDFKPHNVMRTESGAIKVLDFGLARAALDSEVSDGDPSQSRSSLSAALTVPGTVMGTPAYMAPEQHGAQDIDHRSDQYGFCVALWEGLTGERPFRENDYGRLFELKLAGPPSWPKDAPSLPRSIVEAIRRGLRVDPEERWLSMDILLDELRWDPVQRKRRWVMGVGGLMVVGVTAASAQTLVAARAERCTDASSKLDGAWDDARRSEVEAAILRVELPYAAQVWTRTEEALDAYSDEWVTMHTEACEATAVRGEQSEHMLDLRMACLHRVRTDLQATVDTFVDADETVVAEAHRLVAGLPSLPSCADAEVLEATQKPPRSDESGDVERARQLLARARSEKTAGRYEQSQTSVEGAKRILEHVEYGPVHAERAIAEGITLGALARYDAARRSLDEGLELALRWKMRDAAAQAATSLLHVVATGQRRGEDALAYWPVARGLSWGDPRRMSAARSAFGEALDELGRHEEAEAEHRAALALWEDWPQPAHIEIARVHDDLGNVLHAQERHEQSEVEHRLALEAQILALGPEHPVVAGTRNNLGIALHDQGKYEEAEAEYRLAISLYERALGPGHPDTATPRLALGNLYIAKHQPERGEAEFRSVSRLWEKRLGPDHPTTALARLNVGNALRLQGRLEEAEAEVVAVLDIYRRSVGPHHMDTAMAHSDLATIRAERGKLEEAETEMRAALAIFEQSEDATMDVFRTRGELGNLLLDQDKYAEAEVEFRALLEAGKQTPGPDHPLVAIVTRGNLAVTLELRGRLAEAEREYRSVLAAAERHLEANDPHLLITRTSVANLLVARGEYGEALPQAELAWKNQPEHATPAERAAPAFLLARVLWSVEGPRRDRARARTLAEEASSLFRAAGDDFADEVKEVDQWRSHGGRR